jgi:hypothetical protein
MAGITTVMLYICLANCSVVKTYAFAQAWAFKYGATMIVFTKT